MKSNELRIGNLVMSDGYLYKVYHIPDDEDYFEECQPIPLTEEWLVKFGFKKLDKLFYQKQVGDCSKLLIGYKTGPSGCFGAVTLESDLEESYIGHLSGYCKTVNQLQNLYFALTGEELTLKENS